MERHLEHCQQNELHMMAGAWSARVAVLLLLGSSLFADSLRTVSASGGGPCEENLVPEDVLANYAGIECTGDDCASASILDFYNYKVNNGSSTNFTCLVSASPAPHVDEIIVTCDGHPLPSSKPAVLAIFRLSDDNRTAVKIYNVASITKDQLYSCHFVRQSTDDNAGFNHSKTIDPAVYLQPQLTQAPMVETLSGQPGSRYAMWPIWNADKDKGDGPVERYMLCFENVAAGISYCLSLVGSSWQTWVSTSLVDLQPGGVYRLYVRTVRPCSAGVGPPSPFVDYTVPCLASKGLLSIITQSVVINHEEASINVTWSLASSSDPCDAPVDVTVLLKLNSSEIDSATVPASNQSVVLSAKPDSAYVVEAFFYNSQKLKSNVTKYHVVTGSAIPQPPKMHAMYRCNNSSMLAKWRYDGKSPGAIQLYEVLYKRTHDASNVAPSLGCTIAKPFTHHLECVINNLSLNIPYSFTVRAKSSAGYGNASYPLERELTYTVPPPIQSLTNVSRTDQSVELQWHPPTCTGGYALSRYTVSCSTSLTGSPSVNVDPSTNSVNVTGLSPDTEYDCIVVSVTQMGTADPRKYTVRTLASRPSQPARPRPDSDGNSATSYGLRLPPIVNTSLCKVVVLLLDKGGGTDLAERAPEDLDRCLSYAAVGLADGDQTCYTAAQFPATAAGSIVFVVGDNRTYGGFYNAPLRTGSRYAVFYGVGVVGDGVPVFSYSLLEETILVESKDKVVHPDKHGSGETSLGAGVIVGAVCAVVVFLLVGALGLLTYMRRKKHNLFSVFSRTPSGEKDLELKEKGPLLDGINGHGSSDSGGAEDLSRQPDGEPVYDNVELKRYPVLLSELASYVEQKKKDNGLKKEYNLIPWGLMSECTVAKRAENKQRNRYGNIIAYDDSRVLLVRDDAEVTSDYINANYIDGYNSPKYYIATQGPVKNTIKDFWHMVWHEQSPTIIMLTNVIEQGKSKCEQYWPDNGAMINGYGGLTVSLEHTRSRASYDAHYLLLTKGGEKRQIVLFHFRDWPDHGVPSQATALLAFLFAVRSASAGATGPLVSHCSAGVGRTGTCIALDNLLRQAEAEGKVDVYGAVYSMRKQRCNMIQTYDQYVFLHEAILEATLAGNVSFELSAFVDKYDKLLPESKGDLPAADTEPTSVTSDDCSSCFEDEYERLTLVECCLPEPRAIMGGNARRNRDVSVVPCEGTCVPLQNPGLGASDYINACFVDDYLRKGALISTQTPLPDTVGHFWKMLYDRRVSTVVMLNKSTDEDEDEEQQFTVYWPTSTEWNGEYSQVTIQLISESQLDGMPNSGVTVRTFVITPKFEQANRSSTMLHTVTQYECDFWPEEHDVPASRTKFVNLLLKVFWLSKEAANTGCPLVVHCLDGAKQTGLYLACHILMQQAIIDGVVDVRQAVKLIRRCRPQFISSAEQLRYCYGVILELTRSGRLSHDACAGSA